MHPEYKSQSPDDIDQFISAEIPYQHEESKLYAVVQKFMVHGPCGFHNTSSLGMKKQ